MDFIKVQSGSAEKEESGENSGLTLTQEEFDRKSANFRINLHVQKQDLQQYKESQQSGALFQNQQTPFEKLELETNFLKVLKIFEQSRLEADPVFVVETIRAVARCLPAYMKNVALITRYSKESGTTAPKLSQTKYDLKLENVLDYVEKY